MHVNNNDENYNCAIINYLNNTHLFMAIMTTSLVYPDSYPQMSVC